MLIDVPSEIINHYICLKNNLLAGLSLTAGGQGFPPATQSMAPGYFRR